MKKSFLRLLLILGLAPILALAQVVPGKANPFIGSTSTTTASPVVPGFMSLFKYFPDTAHWTTAKNAAATAANPWMKGARFWLAMENFCQISAPPGTTWDTDIANVTNVRTGALTVTRMNCAPVASYDPTLAANLTNMDAVVAGACSVMTAAGTTNMELDPENYSTTTMLFNYGVGAATLTATCTTNQLVVSAASAATIAPGTYINIPGIAPGTTVTVGSGGVGTYTISSSQTLGSGTAGTFGTTQVINPNAYTRAQMAVKYQDLGRQFGLSLWSRIPTATLYLLFGPTQNMSWTGVPSGTQMPATDADGSYANGSIYNIYPYFCLGLLDACPPTGRIVDYCEGGMYGTPGLAGYQRVMYASNNWVSCFFPTYTGLVVKCTKNWVAVPILYPDCTYVAKGTWYAGADFMITQGNALTIGKSYKVKTVGNTDWTTCGTGGANVIGNIFTATNTGNNSGTAGTAYCMTDQTAKFIRDSVYALQVTPDGYLPAVYTDSNLGNGQADPWGQFGAVLPMEPVVGSSLNTALAIYKGTQTWAGAGINLKTLYNTLFTDFVGRTDYQWECQ